MAENKASAEQDCRQKADEKLAQANSKITELETKLTELQQELAHCPVNAGQNNAVCSGRSIQVLGF